MTWTPAWQGSAEIDHDSPNPYYWSSSTGVTTQAVVKRTGSRGFLFDTTGVTRACSRGVVKPDSTKLVALQGAYLLDGAAPSTGTKRIALVLPSNVLEKYYAFVDETRKVSVCDIGLNVLGTTTSTINTAGDMKLLTFIFDVGLRTASTVHVYVWVDGTLEINVNTGQTPTQFFGGTAYEIAIGADANTVGVDIFGDDFHVDSSPAAGDSPQTVAYPLLATAGSYIPTGDGDVNDWDAWTEGVGDHHHEVDEVPPDGDTTCINTEAVDEKELFTQSTGNPVPAGKTVHSVQCFCRGRGLVDTKNGAGFLLRDGADNEWLGTDELAITGIITAYRWGREFALLAPDGGAWAQADLSTALQFGVQSDETAALTPRLTTMYSPEATWEDGSCDLVPTATRRIFIC